MAASGVADPVGQGVVHEGFDGLGQQRFEQDYVGNNKAQHRHQDHYRGKDGHPLSIKLHSNVFISRRITVLSGLYDEPSRVD